MNITSFLFNSSTKTENCNNENYIRSCNLSKSIGGFVVEKAFFQYNIKKSDLVDKIKESGLIILDANALLNVYRFSKDNREKYFEILDVVKDRLFLTYQSVQEFYNNRLTIIYNKSKFKEDLKLELNKKITEIENILRSSNFIGEHKDSCNLIKHEQILQDKIIDILNNAKKEIEDRINSYDVDIDKKFISYEEPILDKILEIFDRKINNPFGKDELKEIFKIGKERYESQIPPGYEDYKNKKEPNCYGDFIIWKEMIDISKKIKRDILFISDDRKPDWCEKFKEHDLGPRKELIKEFFDETSQYFYSITTKDFINYISDLHDIKDTKELERESAAIEKELLISQSIIDQSYPSGIFTSNDASKLKIDPSNIFSFTSAPNYVVDPSSIFSYNNASKLKIDPSNAISFTAAPNYVVDPSGSINGYNPSNGSMINLFSRDRINSNEPNTMLDKMKDQSKYSKSNNDDV